MRLLFLALIFLPVAALGQTPTPDSLSATLPSGRVVHFETAEQKAKFEAAQHHREAAQVQQPTPSPLPNTPSPMGNTALDAPPAGKRVTICGHVLQKIKEGLLVSCAIDAYERNRIPGAIHGKGIIGGEYATGIVLLEKLPTAASLADEDVIANVIARDVGSLEYNAVSGARKTVHAYEWVSGK